MQTPAPCDYERATSVEGAIASLERLGGGARIIAGGHSLIPMMKLRLAAPEHLIDINDLEDELSYIREAAITSGSSAITSGSSAITSGSSAITSGSSAITSGSSGDEIRIGALTRHAELLDSELLAERLPAFRDAERVIADPIVRNRGTIGGSLCQADAAEDLGAVCAALKAKVVIRGSAGERVIGLDGFYTGPFMTAVGDAEILTEVRVPIRPGAGSAHEKVERRAGDFAIAAVSAAVWIDGGTIADAGIGLSALGPTTIIATRAEEVLKGKSPSDELFAEAGVIAAEESMPVPDGRGPVDYKRHLARVLTTRALRRAAARALHQEA
jgi:aerobic carbon-monoxide dehydrogenase medium subunit